jgi:hypothetical protein
VCMLFTPSEVYVCSTHPSVSKHIFHRSLISLTHEELN